MAIEQRRQKIGSSRLHGWGLPGEKARPGAERTVAAANGLPSASAGRQYGSGFAPVDETRTGPQIGAMTPAPEPAPAIEQANCDVSRRRALPIANLLMTYGVPRGSMIPEAASDAEPAYGTSTARGVAANRRAEVLLDL